MRQYDGEGSLKNIVNFIDHIRFAALRSPACAGMTKNNTPTPSLRDTPPRGGRNAPASEGTVPPLSLMPAMGATRDFYSRPPIILLLNFFGVSHKINIELTGMSVRALEKPMCFGANAS